jgi:L-ribulose-5-phosphate 4-epimerase
MLEQLKEEVYKANMQLPACGLVIFTWGNVSGIDRERGLVVIKPSGVEYDDMTVEDMVVVDLDGKVIEGKLRPSSDTPTHLELYKSFPDIGGVTHTHSRWATVFAQNRREIPPLGTTHADYFHGAVPCTRPLSDTEIEGDYELNTGRVIAECHSDYEGVPAVLVASHGVFSWGTNAAASVHNAAVLEEVAFMAAHCIAAESVSQGLLDKHYYRKHGEDAYYGQ